MTETAKEKAKVVKETKTTQTWSIPAYSGKSLVGWGQVTLFKETPDGLSAFRAKVSLSDLKDLNRQKKTDVRNTVARSGDINALMDKVKTGTATLSEALKVLNRMAKDDLTGQVKAKINEILSALTK